MGTTHKGVDELQHRAGTESEQAPNASNDSVQLEGTGDLYVLKLTQKKFLKLYSPAATMDSEVLRDGRILDLIDDAWREDKLPYEDVAIPLNELPEPEQDNGGTTESVKEQEMKWTDLALQYLHENVPPTGN